MEKEFVPYEMALAMQKLGYIEDYENGLKNFGMYCEGVFYRLYPNMGNDIPDDVYREVDAPLYQQAFRWFREKYRLSHIWIMDELLDTGEYTYEEAELACLEKLIKTIEEQK
jgi:hypothetical protein